MSLNNSTSLRITGHAVVEMDEVGLIYERHEYQLTDDLEQSARLVCGQKSADKHWTLFATLAPMLPPRAQECAAKKIGDLITVDGGSGTVRHIFSSFVRETGGATSDALLVGQTYFGLQAQSENTSQLIHWNNDVIYFNRGTEVLAQEAKTAFSNPNWK